MVNAFRTRPLKSHYPFLMVDAIYVKVREKQAYTSRGLLIAIGINEEGHREVVGFQLANSESENSWGEFFGSLKERGLKDVRVVTSDDHKGLVNAVRKHFQEPAGSVVKPTSPGTCWTMHLRHCSQKSRKTCAGYTSLSILRVPARFGTRLSQSMKPGHQKPQTCWTKLLTISLLFWRCLSDIGSGFVPPME